MPLRFRSPTQVSSARTVASWTTATQQTRPHWRSSYWICLRGTSDSNGPGGEASACNVSTDPGCYATSSTEYAASIIGTGIQSTDEHDNTVAAGYQFVLAKYDGQNGGYVLFFLNGAAATLPDVSNPIWGSVGTDQYAIGHHTGFNATVTGTPTPFSSVPDGGTTLILLGAALAGLGLVRRRFNT